MYTFTVVRRRTLGIPRVLCFAGALCASPVSAAASPQSQAPQSPPPRIIYSTSPRAVEYQLNRLSNADLVRVERREDDARYRPVFLAILTRRGLGREYFDEALAALARMDKATPTAVLLDALPRIAPDDQEAAERLLSVLLGGPQKSLAAERERLQRARESATSSWVLQGAYGGLIVADADPVPAWRAAAAREGHLVELLRSIPYLGQEGRVRERLVEPLSALLGEQLDPRTRAAALTALASVRPDSATFRLLAREITSDPAPEVRAAVVRALARIPSDVRSAADVEPVVRALVAQVKATPPKLRTERATVDAIQAAERLADGLHADAGRAVRRELRALGVQIVRIEAVPEQMRFDRRWFVVEAGKPVQIVLYNPDAMAHNLLVIVPGALEEVGVAASTMPLPTDPAVKPYVPDSPLVLQATRLLNWGETERLTFTAPTDAGEYVYVCTFPGHWVRMYGVMLVVDSIEAWESNRTTPLDPMTGKPFASDREER